MRWLAALVLALSIGCAPSMQNSTARDPGERVVVSLGLGVGGASAVAGGSILLTCGLGGIGCTWQNKPAHHTESFVIGAGGVMLIAVGAAAIVTLPIWIAISGGERR